MTRAQMLIFSTLAELGGFTLAAERLGITQSAVSHAVKALEKELNVVLFDRKGATVALSEIGATLLPRAREILGLTEAMYQEAADYRGLNRGSLRIGSFGPTSTLRLLPKILAEFQAKYPGIVVHMDEASDDTVLQWIQERHVDLGFAVLPDDRFETVPLIEDELVALLPSDNPLARKKKVSALELCHYPIIMTEAGSSGLIVNLFDRMGATPDIRMRTSQVMSTLAMVRQGSGVAVVAALALPERLYPGVEVRPLTPSEKRVVGLARLEARAASPAVLAFMATAKRIYSGL